MVPADSLAVRSAGFVSVLFIKTVRHVFKKVIDFSTQKEDADAEIKPQHKEDNGSKTSVHVRVVAEIVEINRESIRKSDPADGGKNRTGKLEPYFLLLIRNKGVKAGKNCGQQSKSQQRAEADNVPGQIFQKWKNPQHQILQGSAEDQKNQGQDTGRHKKERIAGADYTGGKISSSAFALVYPVQTAAYAQHSLGSGPQSQKGCNGNHSGRRFCVQIINDGNDRGFQHFRHK